MISTWITIILWGVISTITFIPHIPACKELNDADKFTVMIIFLIGGPFFAIANVLEQLLDCIMPPGWGGDDDDDFFGRY
jgi:hypothetical protein